MANIMDLFSQAEVIETKFDISNIKDICERIMKVQKTVGGRPKLKAKVASEGINVFVFTNGNRDVIMEKFQGIILSHHKSNVLFKVSDDEKKDKKTPPICSSTDGINGVDFATGERKSCADCPHNVFGTAEKGKGKACKNMNRLYILVEGCPFPITLALPPTSLELWQNYALMDVAAVGLDISEVVTEFGLTKETNSRGELYSIVNFRLVGKVNKKVKDFCTEMGSLIEQTPRIAIDADEYNREPAILQQTDDDIQALPEVQAEQDKPMEEMGFEDILEELLNPDDEPEEVDFDNL